jgi:small-conductance mechanosensitive channel
MYLVDDPPGFLEFFLNQTHLMIIITVSWSLLEVVRTLKIILLDKYDISKEDNLQGRKVYTQVNLLGRVLSFIIITFAVGMFLLSFESIREIGIGLFASAGLAGIIVGLAAQKVIGTLLAGIQLAITQPFRIDDAVIVEGEWGWIEEINLTYVVVRIWDKRRLVVPTTYFIDKPFQNWTRTSADIIGTVFIYTDYTMPVSALRDELTRLLQQTELWDGNVNVLQVTDAKESTVELRALVSAKNSPTAWDLRVYIREKLIEFIQKNYPESLPKTRIKLDNK